MVASKTKSGKARFLLQQLGDGKTYVWKVCADEDSQGANAGAAAAGGGVAATESTAAGSAPAPAAEAEAAEAAAAKSEPGSPSEVDSYSDLPDFSADVAAVREVHAVPATACGGEESAVPAPAQAKAPTQIVG